MVFRKQSVSVGLFSVLAFAVAFAVATDAYATRTRTGGTTYPGSTIDSAIKFFDDAVQITTPSATGVGFDITSATTPGQTVDCTYDDGSGPVNAQCETNVTCKRFEVGTCSQQGNRPGTRKSKMMCPTNTGAGCSGSVTVHFANGNVSTFPFFVDPNISTTQQCNSEFPNIAGVLGKGVIGEIEQSCDKQTPWSANDPVLSEVVRGDVNSGQTTFMSSTSWVDALDATCNSNNGFPTGACTNDGGTWLTVTANTIVNAAVCAASAAELTCGQFVDANGDVQAGPAPSQCRLDTSGQCQCRCARCNASGTLVNLGGAGTGLFVLADANGATGTKPWAAACPVTVTGN